MLTLNLHAYTCTTVFLRDQSSPGGVLEVETETGVAECGLVEDVTVAVEGVESLEKGKEIRLDELREKQAGNVHMNDTCIPKVCTHMHRHTTH